MSYYPGGGFYVPSLGKVNKVFLIIVGVLFLLSSIAQLSGSSFFSLFGLHPHLFWKGHIYQLITYPLISLSLMGLLFNGMVLWFIGSELELLWGPRKYTAFLVLITIGTGFLFLGISEFVAPWDGGALMGLQGIVCAQLICYGLLFRDRMMMFMMIFPVKALTFCLILIGIEVYMGIFTPMRSLSLAHLSSMLLAYSFLKKGHHLSFLWSALPFPLFKGRKPRSSLTKKRHLYLVEDEEERIRQEQDNDRPPKYWQ